MYVHYTRSVAPFLRDDALLPATDPAAHDPLPEMSQNVTLEKDSFLALALASGTSISDAAHQAGIDRRTVYRKLENPAFARQVAEFRDRLIGTALGRVADAMTRGADVLAQMLDSPQDHIRIRAARALISLGLRLRDSVDLTARMREVEHELGRRQEGRS
jgi:hypothetical protein